MRERPIQCLLLRCGEVVRGVGADRRQFLLDSCVLRFPSGVQALESRALLFQDAVHGGALLGGVRIDVCVDVCGRLSCDVGGDVGADVDVGGRWVPPKSQCWSGFCC